MLIRKLDIAAHRAIPAVRIRNEVRIDSGPDTCNQIRQRIAEIFVLSAPEAMPLHVHAAAKYFVIRIESRNQVAFIRREKLVKDRASLYIKIA